MRIQFWKSQKSEVARFFSAWSSFRLLPPSYRELIINSFFALSVWSESTNLLAVSGPLFVRGKLVFGALNISSNYFFLSLLDCTVFFIGKCSVLQDIPWNKCKFCCTLKFETVTTFAISRPFFAHCPTRHTPNGDFGRRYIYHVTISSGPWIFAVQRGQSRS